MKTPAALIRMEALETGWVIHRREELGLSFRMLVPINEELRNNLVYGEKQKLSEVQKEQNQVTFIWRNLYSERAGWLDITVTTTVRAEGPQAVWYTKVENHSPYPVEDLQSPCIGDLTRPQAAKWFRSFFYNYGTAEQASLWPCFDNQRGTHGVDVPTQYVGAPVCAPMGPFYLLRDKDQGLYVGIKSNSCEMVAYTCELHPGYDSSIDSRVPDMDTISGKPVYTFFSSVHMCYIQPGEVRDLTPVALEAYQGDWQKGADIYKAWRDTWMRAAKGPDWSEEPHSWLQLHINSPEDELRLRFTELPEVAKECAKYGVKAIQLVGWNQGGQDQGNPSHTPDPRLGTCEELKQAIADCQKFGVKIILFSKFTWADRGTQWFRQELIKDAIKDPYGDYYLHPGYQYQTPAQLLDINTKRLIPMCFGSRHYREVCNQEFQKLIELNCDGFLFDECLHHSPAALCFDESHGHRYGWPVYSEDRELIKEFQKKPGLRKDFLFSGEAVYDWEFEVYSLSYFRSWSKTHVPLSRYLRPHSQIMTAVNGFMTATDKSVPYVPLYYQL